MKRKELFEFEDFDWLPNNIRVGITNLIRLLHKIVGTTETLTLLIEDLRTKYQFDTIVDLGSGSGGPMIEVIEELNSKQSKNKVKLLLTDLHPNPKTVDEINKSGNDKVSYLKESVNAVNIGETPTGLKTMIASFHHISPQNTKKILQSAEENREPILIYEIAKNNIPFVLWLLLLPISLTILFIMVLFMTPFVKNLTISQLVFTYLIPIIPIVYAWDGQASLMRTYTFDDIRELIGNTNNDNYEWLIGDGLRGNGKKQGYCVIGTPK